MLGLLLLVVSSRPPEHVVGALRSGRPQIASAAASLDSCVRCHRMPGELSHPVNVAPSMQVPEHLPLRNGRLDCTTCHVTEHPALLMTGRSAGGAGPAMLRGDVTGTAFCIQCHEPGAGRGGRFTHAGLLGRAHLASTPWPDETKSVAVAPPASRAGGHFSRVAGVSALDEESRNCLSCHDGSSMGGRRLGSSHPVGVSYEPDAHTVRGSAGQVRPVQMLDRRIRLFYGRLGCGSCHNPYSGRSDMLAVPNHRSSLCLTCHDLQ